VLEASDGSKVIALLLGNRNLTSVSCHKLNEHSYTMYNLSAFFRLQLSPPINDTVSIVFVGSDKTTALGVLNSLLSGT